MLSIVTRIRSRITSSSAPFPGPPLLLSLSMASSSGTRRQADASCGSTRRILTPFLLFYQLRDTTAVSTIRTDIRTLLEVAEDQLLRRHFLFIPEEKTKYYVEPE